MTQTGIFSTVFLVVLFATSVLHIWLALRHLRHVAAHRDAVPAEFAANIPLEAHQKAADYTQAKTRLGLAEFVANTLLLLIFTFGGILQSIHDFWPQTFPESIPAGNYPHSLLLFGSLALVGFIIDLPFGMYRTFVIEERFGFNKMTWSLFVTDIFKQGLLAIAIGTPLLLAVLWLMAVMGANWWLYVWLFWLTFNLLVLLLYPTLIAPLFNKFSPLDNAELESRIEALLTRCGFRSNGLFVMDGSKRSSHGNAYFTGFGAAKRIVFFDTLIERLAPAEIEAVLAHELGHYKHRHVWKRIGLLAISSFALLWLLGILIAEPWFYNGLGVSSQGTALALILFSLVLPVFTFPLSPLFSRLSCLHEYEADAYASRQAQAGDLVSALVKLYRDNAATLTPDPLHSLFYDSHPPASLRIARLQSSTIGKDHD